MCGTAALKLLCSGLIWAELWLCPQPDRSHAFFSAQWRQQVLLTQELQGEVDQQASDGLQLLCGLLGVCVAEPFLAGVFLQLSHVVDSVVGQALENLCQQQDHSADRPTRTKER